MVERLNTLYNGRLLAEAIFLGSNEQAVGVDQQQILEKTRSALVSQLADEVREKTGEKCKGVDIAPSRSNIWRTITLVCT